MNNNSKLYSIIRLLFYCPRGKHRYSKVARTGYGKPFGVPYYPCRDCTARNYGGRFKFVGRLRPDPTMGDPPLTGTGT